MSSSNFKLSLLTVSALAVVQITTAGDPDILSDFFMFPPNNSLGGNFFTYTGFRPLTAGPNQPAAFKVTKASMVEFPPLIGQSVSYTALEFPASSVNPPHTHPRASELLLVAQGSLEVGFVDTTNKLYLQKLQTGDMFVFPKGLVHFQYNADAQKSALALSAFGSANAGTVSLPANAGMFWLWPSRLTLPPSRN